MNLNLTEVMNKVATLLLVALVNLTSYAQKNEGPILSLTGTARQYVLPDLAIITLMVRMEDTDEGKAVQKVNETTKVIADKMKGFGFQKDQVKLTDFLLEEKFTHKKNEGRIRVGYVGQQTIKVKTFIDAETISRFLVYISKNKLENTTIHFVTQLSEDLEAKTKLQLIEKALKNSRTKAELIAKTSGATITGIDKIGYNESESVVEYANEVFNFNSPILKRDEEIRDENALESDITSLFSIEEIEVGESVSVIYKIKNNQ